ncbi:MAG: hypothetical protein CMP30_13795 [Roseibacillus sp.]|nr:hypothetical protein [Roseibacillus sp.]
MCQGWKDLLFLHWKVPVAQVQAHLPRDLKADNFGGGAWIGVVPFSMRGVRPKFLPCLPGLSNFLELNVRTYVYDKSGVPGVWFFSLDANQRIACGLGRSLFNLNYRMAEMEAEKDVWIDYRARREGCTETAAFRHRPSGPRRVAKPGTLEFFLTERYVLYANSKDGSQMWRGRVHHPPYELQDAEVESFSTLPIEWNGQDRLSGQPQHTCASMGVDVDIFSLERL